MKQFLGGKVTLFGGDSREVLKEMPDNCVDSICTDPPYALVSIVKRFGKPGSAPAKGNEAFMRASRGFMGKEWDTGEVAFDPEFWAECLRVLKPGGHLLSCGGTRTYHRMACAIEDAGFEIRDCLSWNYGQGFPKSHDVSRNLNGSRCSCVDPMCSMSETQNDASCLVQESEQTNMFKKMQRSSSRQRVGEARIQRLSKSNGGIVSESSIEGTKEPRVEGRGDVSVEQRSEQSGTMAEQSEPQNGGTWENCGRCHKPIIPDGLGTALKPAMELIVLARKPLSEKTVAVNVLKWGTGAINIDGCRVELSVDGEDPRLAGKGNWSTSSAGKNIYEGGYAGVRVKSSPLGRFPANVLHDGSDEVIAAFPDTEGRGNTRPSKGGGGMYGHGDCINDFGKGDSGSAARFFYAAKANKKDRAGSKHPTVKPIKLLRYLIRLITPPGGVVLDPFAGSGTTGEAAYMENCRAILIEREAEYQEDIASRLRGLDNVIDRSPEEDGDNQTDPAVQQ